MFIDFHVLFTRERGLSSYLIINNDYEESTILFHSDATADGGGDRESGG